MRRRQWVSILLLLGIGSGWVYAQTGKISGVVTDDDTREALVGANILVEGTMQGAASGLDGSYTILNLRPGVYRLRTTMMGYRPVVVENIRVSIGQTTTIDFSLPPTVLETEEAVTIVAERPLVNKGMTSSFASVSAEEIQALPVSSMTQVLELQAGVVRSGGNLHIRGGRAGEVAFWVDGVAATDVYSGNMGVAVENSAIQELQVVSGTFNAEYGQAMSGIVNIVTKEGGAKYTGDFMAYAGDYISDGSQWNILKDVEVATDPVTGRTQAVGVPENPLKAFNPSYNTEFNLSGPVPFLGKNVTFFANSRYQSTEGYFYGRRWFLPSGNPGDSSIVPMNPYWRYSGQGKITWRMSSNLKLSYNLFHNQWHNDRSSPGLDPRNYRYNPDGLPQQDGRGTTHILSWNHLLSPKTFYEARVTRFYNEYSNYVLEDPLAKSRYLVRVDPDTARGFEGIALLDPNTPEGQAQLEWVKNQRYTYTWFIDPAAPLGYVHPDSAAPPTSYSHFRSGMGMGHFKRSSAYWIGKADLTSQVHRAHQIKGGFEARYHELTLDQFTLQPLLVGGGEPKVPFEPMVYPDTTVNHHKYRQNPIEFSAYIQDKIELKEINLNIGVRFDYFDANTNVPTDPRDPNIYYPFLNQNIYKDWVEPPPGLTQEERRAYIAQFKKYTPEERRAFMQKKATASYAVSPRLGIAYPISDRGVIHFSYGHFFQIPDFQRLYSNPDFKLSESGGYVIFGNPNLKPERTVQYEIGLQQQLTEVIGVDVTLFYKDIRDWVGTSPLINTPIPSVKYSQYENKEYANVRGVTVKLEKRYANNFSAGVDYMFQVAEGTYSNPDDAFNAIQDNAEPRKYILPLNWDQSHTLNGRFIFRTGTWTASLIGRFWSGRPYTPTFAVGEVVGGTATSGLKENSARLPSQKSVDLYVNKRIPVSGINLNVFMNVYNVFDTRDELNVYTDTGTAAYTTTIKPENYPYNTSRVGTLETYIIQPNWYSAPRQVQLGLSIGF